MSSKKAELRDNLLVTIGCRAGHMECLGFISIPSGVDGEDKLARFASRVVDRFIEDEFDMSFDEYIESALEDEYGGK